MNFKEKIKTNIKYKLRVTFFISILIGNLISTLIIAPWFQDKVENKLKEKYYIIIDNFRKYKDDDEKIKAIIESYNNLDYKIKKTNDISNLKINEKDKLSLNSENKIIYSKVEKYQIKAISKIKDEYFIIYAHHSDVKFLLILINLWILLITTLVSFVIISCATKNLVNPIEKLSKATNKIASGDYNIKIETKSNDEIANLINSFNFMANELNNLDYMQRDFINNVSHEFKTPIAAVKGYLTILKSENLSQEERLEYIGIILDEINRLSTLSTNILELSKLDNMDSFDNKEKFLLDEQLRKTVILLEKEWSKKNINFNLDLDKTYYYGREDYLNEVWLNIIYNAIKFSNENGVINISLKKTANEVIIFIEDFGSGMSENTLKYLFNRFYKGDESRNDSGYGLGLALSKKIIELSKGTIEVESELNKFTKFIVKLPF